MDAALGQRIIVVGTSGSGKTTLALWLGRHLGIPHVELDALHWEPHWTEAPLEVFRERVVVALAGERWSVDGNYSDVRDLVWPHAETLVWLDYPLFIILWRLMRRTIGRILSHQELT